MPVAPVYVPGVALCFGDAVKIDCLTCMTGVPQDTRTLGRQTHGHSNGQTDRQTDTMPDSRAHDRHRDRQTHGHKERHTDKLTDTRELTQGQTHRHTDKQVFNTSTLFKKSVILPNIVL